MSEDNAAERVAQAGLQAVRAEAGGVAAQWTRRLNGGSASAAPADVETRRDEAEALIVLLLDAADAEASPSPVHLTRRLGQLARGASGATIDRFELIEQLDGLCELLHESLNRQFAALEHASPDAALIAAHRMSRALRGMLAATVLLPDAPSGGSAGAADGAATPDAAAAENGGERGGDGGTAADFVRRLAHDLKNPLGTAKGAAETLIDESALENPQQRQQFAEIVIRSLDRAVELIDGARRSTRGSG